MKKALAALMLTSLAALQIGCESCGTTRSEPSIHFVPKDAEAVLEVRDVRLLVRLREGITKNLSAFVTPAQVESLRDELVLTLGFDPSTEEGLEKAGLKKQGSIAVQIADGGRSGLWVLPISDATKFGQTVQNVAAARVGVSKTTTEKTERGEITLLQSEFGPDLVTVAAYATKGGVGLIGAGKEAKALVAAGLATTAETSVASHPEYGKQVGALGTSWEVRMISPSGGKALSSALELLSRRVGPIGDQSAVKHLVSAGWSADLTRSGVKAQGNLRLDEAGLEKAKKLFVPDGKTPAGVRAVDIPGAAILLQVGGDPDALIATLFPPGSPNRARLDTFFTKVKDDTSTDVEQEVLPLLSGHGSVAFGVGDLTNVPFRALARNPMAAMWTAFAVGVKDEKTILAIEKRLDPSLEDERFKVTSRNAAGKDVRVVTAISPRTGASSTLVETFGKQGAMVFSNEPQMTNVIVANEQGRDLLGAEGGLALQVRFDVIAERLKTFPVQSLPALFRAMARKAVEAVGILDRLTLEVRPSKDGVSMTGELSLALGK